LRTYQESAKTFEYHIDTITTDTSFSILEIALAPQNNLHIIHTQILELFDLLTTFFTTQNCRILGYGIQPLTPPSRKLLMPKERYRFFEKFSTNRMIPKSLGADSDLLNITASNQCHIKINKEEAIDATNVLNALSGLQIALHANSPIWKGEVRDNKANREIFWDYCFPNRRNQVGIPPKFETIGEYIKYLLQFKPLLVSRSKKFFQILDKKTFGEFLFSKTKTFGRNIDGEKVVIEPKVTDIHDLNNFCWFNARLVPKYGTIESRMCCQQPQGETLTSTALTLGILENLEAAKTLMNQFSWEAWRNLRKAAARKTFDATIENEQIVPLLSLLLDIATDGLKKRNLGEAIFLAPLFERLKLQQSPADVAISIFEKEGIAAFLNYSALKLNIEVAAGSQLLV